MGKMTVSGLEDFTATLQQLGDQAGPIMKMAVYAGADKMIGEVKNAIKALPTQDGYMKEGKRSVVTEDEKRDLLDHVGIAKIDNEGGNANTAIGFNGYSSHKTRKYPNGVPIPLIARSIESGSSVRKKIPFLRKAGKAATEKVQQAMLETAAAEFNKLTK